ncbi:NAD-dependent epimerase/dehydratase family protein [Aestuariirhabdus litorea]|uniref:NAD-dependent epimerase/dehydratase family protein n=1 Tax=Aestuariirhabdus litorea TaxID=2528527 RepID=A0A3P3VIN0_9GAMM|nr:NAD-dependent epimerase/dehydratase family protein [Aestuariirhabdus litorea]RRJ82522.1 NAD-dependent epimerase/dehydratase family protein [Aestuariirhabdus litorea]RWW92683.1 NAD-dependent epimerase/dehydratase family protein [Endozoicomonadaceae bacterium GTF-13]
MNRPTSPRVLIIGCGDVGNALGLKLLQQGASVWGMRRDCSRLAPGIVPLEGDFNDPACWHSLPDSLDYLVFTAAASERSDQGYKHTYVDGVAAMVRAASSQPTPPRRLLFTSSTAVYHQGAGEWVDETSATQPRAFNGQRMLEAEARLAAAPMASTSVRFSGIYGPGRERLIQRVKAGRGCEYQPAPITNRIHRDDCAGVLAHLIALDWQGSEVAPLYVASDSEPCAMDEVLDWLAGQLGIELSSPEPQPCNIPSKRCSNRRLLETGYPFIFPDFRAGYGALLAARPES